MKPKGFLWPARWFQLGAAGGGQPNTATTPPELELPIGNGLNITLTVEATGVGPACGANGPLLEALCSSATTDIDAARPVAGTVIQNIGRKRYTVTKYTSAF